MSKLYTRVGVTTHLGSQQIRFGNVDRTKILEREGHTDIRFVDFGPEMQTKEALVQKLKQHEDFQGVEDQKLIEAWSTPAAKPAKTTPVETADTTSTVEDDVESIVELPVPDTQDSTTVMTFEEALATIPKTQDGKVISKKEREAQARALIQE